MAMFEKDRGEFVENVEAYLARKHQEVLLINASLDAPIRLRRARSVAEVIKQKFQLAAALKAERALGEWNLTETGWTDAQRFPSGPFEFSYGYQRADLQVRGPAIYEAFRSISDDLFCQSIYTCSGMAAISSVLMALK